MLVGRKKEIARIQRLLADARQGRGGALVVCGEAGIGKTALLEHAVAEAAGFRVLRALGVEAEAELPFAALHELVRSILGLLDDLPEPQATALKAALALASGDRIDRFSAYAGTLGLMSAATAERPLLCVVDDAQWLDDGSAEALTFTGRRVEHEAVVMLFAAREPDLAAFSARGLPEIRLGGLEPEDAKALLSARAPSLAPELADRLVQTTKGNPLAMLEFAPVLAAAEQPEAFGEPLPVSELVERAFLERASCLSTPARRALIVVGAGDPAESDAIWAALELEGVPAAAVAEAEAAGFLTGGRRLDFCHPLARSALYQSATPADRRAAHHVLAETTEAPERRAWHLAGAASGPDAEAAAALEQAATIARSRGGVSAEASALERAARLTPELESCTRRLFRAALAAESAGRLEQAEELLIEVAARTPNPTLRADAVASRSYLLCDRGQFDRAIEVATAEADGAAPAIEARVLSARCCVVAALVHRLELPAALETAQRAARLAPNDLEGVAVRHQLVWTWELSGRWDEALALARECASRVELGNVLATDVATDLLYLEDYRRARELLGDVVEHERAAGAIGNLAYALDQLAKVEERTGSLTAAYALSLESVSLTQPLGNDVALAASLGWLAHLEAMLGRSEARAHGLQALEVAEKRGDRWNEVRARAGLGLYAVAHGDPGAVVEWLEPAAEMLGRSGVRDPNVFRIHGDLIEAQLRVGSRDQGEAQLAHLQDDAQLTGSGWALAVAARCRAILVDDADADEAFEAALELHELDPSEFERARTQLAYGERLRRLRQRRRARVQLHVALQSFERIGARPWADRARAELRATGARVRRREPAAHVQLTPQELQVVLAAAEGLTNKEIGARLFLSPKTVDFHLGHAYRKLDVHSRKELIKLYAGQPLAVERLPP